MYVAQELDPRTILGKVSAHFGLGLDSAQIEGILQHKADHDRRQLTLRVSRSPGLPARLAEAVGAENIRARLPVELLESAVGKGENVSGERLAELALAAYGAETLKEFRAELATKGFVPPTQWAGGTAARRFVADLGFPPEYAGFPQTRREALLTVDGPPALPPLHGFQEHSARQIKQALQGVGGNRGLLSLPTGAGKTRVAVQAIVDVIRDHAFPGPILWVAQSDELCEQAVQSWSYVWRAIGPKKPLYISRLWAANEAEEFSGNAQVVIATIAKLQVCFENPEYGWLSNSSCLVIDEAHAAVTPEYTKLLEWLGVGRGNDRCPIVGLTATPFRGTSIEQTARLVKRFGQRRFDTGAFAGDPYPELQNLGVLAKVRHELLEGSAISLSQEEPDELRKTRLLPSSVGDRVGADRKRNKEILASLQRLPKDWTAVVFAASVSHAQSLAALLTLRGTPAVSISASTEPAVRRHYIDQFRLGRIRVISNYGVLAQGFDAPSVRAVYVTRPTFSPNLYQQMIGRGLRGPLNGGKDECLIVNVRDNFLNFGQKLAFTEFEHIWQS